MAEHEFGIIDCIDKHKSYIDYCPEQYDCITIDDSIMELVVQKLEVMPTYFFSLDKKEHGLNYYGVTLIPPDSFWFFQEILVSFDKGREDKLFNDLCSLIMQARDENKYIIHFGL